jgi:hypothetical protein
MWNNAQTPYKRARVGLCTSWLSQLEPSTRDAEVTLDVWVAPGSLRPPPSVAVPLIAVGPGTGVAPMRSLLQDRDVHCRVRLSSTSSVTPLPAHVHHTNATRFWWVGVGVSDERLTLPVNKPAAIWHAGYSQQQSGLF